MSILTNIGIEESKANRIAEGLNDLLANYQIFYINVRGYHWNIKGDKFFELHVKFEELYTDLQLKNDEIAERILTLGHTPLHSFEDYLKASTVQPTKNVSDGKEAVSHVLAGFKAVIAKQRALLEVTDEAGDEGTNALMSDYIREQEKLVWMYGSFMGH